MKWQAQFIFLPAGDNGILQNRGAPAERPVKNRKTPLFFVKILHLGFSPKRN
jgi:hypothetical protein